jgi:hypothetical protein
VTSIQGWLVRFVCTAASGYSVAITHATTTNLGRQRRLLGAAVALRYTGVAASGK